MFLHFHFILFTYTLDALVLEIFYKICFIMPIFSQGEIQIIRVCFSRALNVQICRDAVRFHKAHSTSTVSRAVVVIPHQDHHEVRSKTPDLSRINQLKPRIKLSHLHANSNPCLIYERPIVNPAISLKS